MDKLTIQTVYVPVPDSKYEVGHPVYGHECCVEKQERIVLTPGELKNLLTQYDLSAICNPGQFLKSKGIET